MDTEVEFHFEFGRKRRGLLLALARFLTEAVLVVTAWKADGCGETDTF